MTGKPVKQSAKTKPKLKPNSDYKTLCVITHTQSFHNKNRIFSGRLESKLTKEGHRQAKLIAKILKNHDIQIAYKTSLSRTQETLNYILAYHPETIVITDNRLIERDYGLLSGKSKDKYAKAHPKKFPIYHRSYNVPPPKGESMKTVEKRVTAALKDIIQKIRKEKVNVLIVAHGNSIRPIIRYFNKLTPKQMMKLENTRNEIFTFKIKV